MRRLLYLIPTLWLISLIVFVVIHLVPGDPTAFLIPADQQQDPVLREAFKKVWGLDKPLYLQYLYWISNILQGNFGKSFLLGQNVGELLMERIPLTFALTTYSMIIALFIAIPSGIIAAVKRNTRLDYGVMAFALLGVSIPGFWLALILILIFALKLGWFPSIGYVNLSDNFLAGLGHLTLPALTLGAALAAVITRMLRSSMLEELNKEYVRTARAKGLKENLVIFKHALKNALIPTITVIGLQFAGLLGGTLIIEQIFGLPGIGRLYITAIFQRDYPVVQGGVLIIAFFFVIINLLVDIFYRLANPRIKLN